MNDPSPIPSGAACTPVEAAGRVGVVDPSRRRLVRTGLTGSVLLGSLVSKPVLGAEYICTVSGHASGNASAHLIEGVDCAAGEDATYWLNENAWPTAYERGFLPDENCAFKDSGGKANPQGTLMSEAGLLARFYYSTDKKDSCVVKTFVSPQATNDYLEASMLQVLSTSSSDEVFQLGRAAVVSLLNAADLGPAYPITAARIIDMFNKVVDDGLYHVDGANINLRRLGVIQYLEKLYTPSV